MTVFTCVAALGVAIATYGGLDAYDRVPGVLTLDPAPGAAAASTSAGTPVPRVAVPSPSAPPTRTPAPVTVAGLRRGLGKALQDPRLGTGVSATVRDGRTGAPLLDVAATTPRTPASTAKLLTAAAVLPELGPDARLTTSTLLAPDGTVVLRAGGDVLLGRGESRPDAVEGHAGVRTLARATAARLVAQGRTRVPLRLDLSYAAGPGFAPGWDEGFLGQGIVGTVAQLGLAEDLVEPGRPGRSDPPAAVAEVLRAELARAGVQVTGETTRGAAPAGATPLASVRSAPVAEVMAVALDRSDNALTETLARQAVAHAGVVPAGRPVTFPAAAAWVRGALARQGHDLTGVRLVDTCGLSPGTTVTARLVADVLAAGVTGRDPAMARAIGALPVAGLTGTLAERFTTGTTAAGAGQVRAKTGTLTGTSSLAGTVATRDGGTLAFVVLANGVPASTGTLGARQALDEVATRLASCGCR